MSTNETTVTKPKKISLLLGFLGAAALTGMSAAAHAAATVTGVATQVEFNAGSPAWPQVAVQVNSVNTNYYAQQPSPGCNVPALSADSVKGIQSLLQAALLAGRTVTLNYNTCNGANYLFDVIVKAQ